MCSELLTIVDTVKTFISLHTQAVTCVCINILLNPAVNTPLHHLYQHLKCQRKPHYSEAVENTRPLHLRTLTQTHRHTHTHTHHTCPGLALRCSLSSLVYRATVADRLAGPWPRSLMLGYHCRALPMGLPVTYFNHIA